MYNQFFGLQEDPFSLTPDPRFLFMTWRQRQVLAGLTYALISRKRCIALTGDIGAGKTTMIAAAVWGLPADRVQFSLISNPTLTADEILEAALLGFGLTEIPGSKPLRLSTLERFVGHWKDQGRTSAVVIDEAQKLPVETLEQIRLLGNLEFLQIVLVGQNELNALLGREELRALKQRIAVHLALEPLSAEDVGRYIEHRWVKAGGTRLPFAPDALETVVRYAAGTPRLINALCDNALAMAHEETVPVVSARHMHAAAASLKLLDAEQVSGAGTGGPPAGPRQKYHVA